MTAPVVVYTQSYCADCREVERFLAARNVPFATHDVAHDPVALNELIFRGYMSTPVIKVGDRWIAGFKKKQIERALKEWQEGAPNSA